MAKQRIYAFAFEGIDGAGKTTLIREVYDAITAVLSPAAGLVFVHQERQPSEEVALGEATRAAIKGMTLDHDSELLALTLNRRLGLQRLQQLADSPGGHFFLIDRWVGTCLAYQGHDSSEVRSHILNLHDKYVGGFMPLRTYLLDIDAAEAAGRLLSRGQPLDWAEADLMRQHQISKAYRELANNHGWLVLDATLPTEKLAQIVVEDFFNTLEKIKNDEVPNEETK